MIYFFKILFLISIGLAHIASWAVKEDELKNLLPLLQKESLFSLHNFQGVNDFNLNYIKFGNKKGSKGSLIFVTGFGEGVLMYLELYYDLYLKGWSPIYSYDHRGQGQSTRALEDRNVSYIEDWSFYSEDLKTFFELALINSKVDQKDLYLIAHSMGANITSTLFQSKPKQQELFNAVVFSAPLFGIYASYLDILSPIFPSVARITCLFYGCLKPLRVSHSYKKQRKFSRERITNSITRFNWYHKVSKQYNSYGVLPSLDWAIKALDQSKQILKEKNIEKIQKPLLILQSKDEKVVSNPRQNKFCKVIDQKCRIKVINGRHAHFLEIDEHRDQAIAATVKFFESFSNKNHLR